MRVLVVISLSAMMVLCAVAEDRNTILKEFQSLTRQQQVTRIKALLVKGFMDDKLREFLESLKDIMINGSTEWGIPPLDPFIQEHLDVDLNEEEQIQLEATIDQLKATGLSNYAVDRATFDLFKQNISFGLSFFEIRAVAEQYWMNGTVADILPIYGEGSIDISVTNLSIGGDLIIALNGSYVFLKDVDMDITIGALKMNITGLLGGGERGDLINEIISESAPEVWEELKPDIMPEINSMVIEMGNQALSGLTLQDIIDMITGNNKSLR